MTHLDDLAALRDAARLGRRAIAETGANARRSGALAGDADTLDTLAAALDVLGDLADVLNDQIAARTPAPLAGPTPGHPAGCTCGECGARRRHPAGRRLIALNGGAP